MRFRGARFAAIGLAVTMALAVPGRPAGAQTWIAADPEGAALGPGNARGAVIWSHGRSLDAEDYEAATPPFIDRLRQGGWDAFRFNRARADGSLSAGARTLVEGVHGLKQQGYRQIVLAGQSFGGFLSLLAADTSDEVDAVIATAPAAYGSYADQYETWRDNATVLYPILQRVRRARVMLFYFHGDDFDPGGRGERSRDILAEHRLDYVVIDQPPRLTTHWAAATPLFAQLYGDCILSFIDADGFDPGAQCNGGTYWAAPASGSPAGGPRFSAASSAAGP